MAQHRRGYWFKRILTVAGFVAAGLIVSALHTYFKHRGYEPESYGLTILDHLSVALFAAPVLGAIIEMPHMFDYFKGLIEETIMQKKYLKDLNDQALDDMKQKCLEAFFHIDQLDKEFYTEFYKENLEKQIGNPLRINTVAVTTVKANADNKSLDVTDVINFDCKKVGNDILKEVRWTTLADEINEMRTLKLSINKPNEAPKVYTCNARTLAQPAGVREPLRLADPKHGCTLQLSDYKGCDNLHVALEVTYNVPRGRAFSWTMPCLSKGFKCTIIFPTEFEIFADPFGIDSLPGRDTVKTENGMKVYSFDYKKWLLHDDGFAFSFSRYVQSGDGSGSSH
jgi:hypothetical protein